MVLFFQVLDDYNHHLVTFITLILEIGVQDPAKMPKQIDIDMPATPTVVDGDNDNNSFYTNIDDHSIGSSTDEDMRTHSLDIDEDDDDNSSIISTGSSSCSDDGPTTCFICSERFSSKPKFRKYMRQRHPRGSMSPLNVSMRDVFDEVKMLAPTFARRTHLHVGRKRGRRHLLHPNEGSGSSEKLSSVRSKAHEGLRPTVRRSSTETLAGPANSQSSTNTLLDLASPIVTPTKKQIGKDDFPRFRIFRIVFKKEETGEVPKEATLVDNPQVFLNSGHFLLNLSEEDIWPRPLVRTIDSQEGHLESRDLLQTLDTPWGLHESLPLNPRGTHMNMAVVKRGLSKKQGGGNAFSRGETVLVLKHDGVSVTIMGYDGQAGSVKQWDLEFRSLDSSPP